MARSTPEWIGKTDNTQAPPRVRIRCFEHNNRKCHLCGQNILVGDKWELDHIIALINGGENRQSNLAPAHKKCHRRKTAQDVAEKSKIARIKARHIGAAEKRPWSKFKKRMDGTVVDRKTGEPV